MPVHCRLDSCIAMCDVIVFGRFLRDLVCWIPTTASSRPRRVKKKNGPVKQDHRDAERDAELAVLLRNAELLGQVAAIRAGLARVARIRVLVQRTMLRASWKSWRYISRDQ